MTEYKIIEKVSLIDSLTNDLEKEPYSVVRKYLTPDQQTDWRIDWNMLLYTPEDKSNYELDWNKLIYNEEQLAEFNAQKQDKIIHPDKYEYLFENVTQRTAMEIFHLKQAGYDVDDQFHDNETIVNRLVINGLLREV